MGESQKFKLPRVKGVWKAEVENGQTLVIGFCFLEITLLINPNICWGPSQHCSFLVWLLHLYTAKTSNLGKVGASERHKLKPWKTKASLKPSHFCHSTLILMCLHITFSSLTCLSPFSAPCVCRHWAQISSLLWRKDTSAWPPGSLSTFLPTCHCHMMLSSSM
jgi:hypothetical protein